LRRLERHEAAGAIADLPGAAGHRHAAQAQPPCATVKKALKLAASVQPPPARRTGELEGKAHGGDARLARELRADAGAEREIGEDCQRAKVGLARGVNAPGA